jgi:hypothetical protein
MQTAGEMKSGLSSSSGKNQRVPKAVSEVFAEMFLNA